MTHFTFEYKEILQTAHPDHETRVHFLVLCIINGDEVTIKEISVELTEEDVYESLPLPNEKTSAGAKFAGLLREHARKKYYELEKHKATTEL